MYYALIDTQTNCFLKRKGFTDRYQQKYISPEWVPADEAFIIEDRLTATSFFRHLTRIDERYRIVKVSIEFTRKVEVLEYVKE